MRLIDADKLLNKIDAYMCGSQDVMFVKELIKEQPTAFNVDKVAGHIEDLKEENFKRGIKENEPALLYASSCLHKALEIIKAGGIDE